jgi:hypothetical protein
LTVRNTGRVTTGTIRATVAGRDSAEVAITATTCATLDAGESCTVSLALRPLTAGPKLASLRVSATPGGDAVSILSGLGLTPSALLITPAERDFGTVSAGTSVGPVSFSVRNTGESPAGAPAVSLTATSPGGLAFLIVGNGCRVLTIPPGGECVVTVRATAIRGGAPGTLQTARLTVDTPEGATADASLRLTTR